MKNKKLLISVLCISVGCIMLFATAFASSAGTTGYEAYKAALKATSQAKSFTADVNVEVKDNGQLLGSADMLMKAGDIDTHSVSVKGSVKAGDHEESFEMYQQLGQSIIKTTESDIYYVSANNLTDRRAQSCNIERDPDALKAGETIVDALVGNLKDYFTVSGKADGGSTVDFRIKDSQIPAVVNALTSLSAKKGSDGEGRMTINNHPGMPSFMTGMHPDMPKLVEDVRVEEISLNADIGADGIITGQTIHAAVSGKDSEGNTHRLEVDMDMALSELSNTTADTVDLEGKQTQTIELEKYGEN